MKVGLEHLYFVKKIAEIIFLNPFVNALCVLT